MKTQPIYSSGDDPEYLAKALSANWGWINSNYPEAPGNDLSLNNATGFSALPAGEFYSGFACIGFYVQYWSATEDSDFDAYFLQLCNDGRYVIKVPYFKAKGYSVRCVRD